MGNQLTGEIVSSICYSIAERPTADGILFRPGCASRCLGDICRPVKKIFCPPTHPIDFGMMWKRSERLPMTWGGPWTFVLKDLAILRRKRRKQCTWSNLRCAYSRQDCSGGASHGPRYLIEGIHELDYFARGRNKVGGVNQPILDYLVMEEDEGHTEGSRLVVNDNSAMLDVKK